MISEVKIPDFRLDRLVGLRYATAGGALVCSGIPEISEYKHSSIAADDK